MPKRIRMNYAEKKLKRSDISAEEQFGEIIASVEKVLKKIEKIDAVVLFGSFARGDYSERHSDIDIMIFLDEAAKNPDLEQKILKKIIGLSMGKKLQVHALFQYLKVGEEDKSLLLTIADEGKVIFSKKSIVISQNILGLKTFHLVKLDTTGLDQVSKNKLNRFLHGYTMNGNGYQGIIDDENVLAAGKGALIAPKELAEKIITFAESIGVKAKLAGRFYR